MELIFRPLFPVIIVSPLSLYLKCIKLRDFMVYQMAFAKKLYLSRKIDDLRFWDCLARIKAGNRFVYTEKVSIFAVVIC